jgi:hypothetical protein
VVPDKWGAAGTTSHRYKTSGVILAPGTAKPAASNSHKAKTVHSYGPVFPQQSTCNFCRGSWTVAVQFLPGKSIFTAISRHSLQTDYEAHLISKRYATHGIWLRHYATSRKIAGSIPVEFTGFFNWPNPSSSTMALESTQPLTEMNTSNLPGS